MLRRRFRHVLLDLCCHYLPFIADLQRRQWPGLLLILPLAPRWILQRRNVPPAVLQHNTPCRAEGVFSHLRDNLCRVVFARRIERRQHSPHHHIPQMPLIRAHSFEIHAISRRQQRMVIRHLASIEHAFCHRQLAVWHGSGHKLAVFLRQQLHGLLHLGDHVIRQIAAVCAGISQRLVRFI